MAPRRTRNFMKSRNGSMTNFITLSGQYNFTADEDGPGGTATLPFAVLSVVPVMTQDLPSLSPIVVTFSMPASPGAVPLPREAGVPKAGGLVWNANFTQLTYTPSSSWAAGALVDWDLTAFTAADGTGAPVNAYLAQWTAETPLTLLSADPDPADPNLELTGQDAIVAKFNAPLTTTVGLPDILQDGAVKAGTWVLGPQASWATFTPSTNWAPSSNITLDPASGVSPTGATIGGAPIAWVAARPPFHFGSSSPPSGSSMSGNQSIAVIFTDAVNPASVISVDEDGVPKAGSWFYAGSSAVFTPASPWRSGAVVSVDASLAFSTSGVPVSTGVFLTYNVPVTFAQIAVSPVTGSVISGTDTITVSFNETPDVSTMALPTENGITKPGTWAAVGSSLTFTPSSPYASGATIVVDWASVTDVFGNPPTNVGAASYTVPVSFNYLSAATGQGDNRLWDQEKLILTFDAFPRPSSLPLVLNSLGTIIPGNWTVVGATAEFVPNANWQDTTGPVTVATAGIMNAANSVLNSTPTVVSMPIATDLVRTHHFVPTTGFRLTGTDGLAIGYNLSGITTDATVTENGVPKAGSWAQGFLNDRIFTPATSWARGATVVLDWSGAAAGPSTMTNPGSQTYLARDWFELVSSTPTQNGFIGATQPLVLTYDKPIFVAQGLPTPAVQATNQPIAGSWAAAGNTITFTPTNPWPPGTDIYIRYDLVTPTDGTPHLNGPQSLTFRRALPITYQGSFPATGSTFTGASQILLIFDQPPLLSSLPQPQVIQGFLPTAQAGGWTVTGNNAQFTPTGNWLTGPVLIPLTNVQSAQGEAITNPSTLQWAAN
jgi:hypothetical protein